MIEFGALDLRSLFRLDAIISSALRILNVRNATTEQAS